MYGAFGLSLVAVLLLVPPASADEAEEARRLNDLAFDLMLEGQGRVMAIADRIRIGGAGLCGKKIAPVIGVFAADHKTIDDMWRDKDYVDPFVEASIERYQLGREPRVLLVAPGLPAAEAGLQPGDVVKAVDGKEIKKRVYLDVLRNRGKHGVVQFEIEREGVRHQLEIEARMGCTVPSRFRFGPEVNAFAISFGNITGMYFYSGMLRYLPNDDHLALVVGHELAHHVLGHTNQPRTSERTEAEADYLGLYFSARAGYDISVAPELEDAFARTSPYSSVKWGYYTHPTSAKRSLEQRAAIAEIQSKQAGGEPLEPEKGSLTLKRPEVDEEELEAHQFALREEALQIFRSQQERIQNVSYRLAAGGRAACGDRVSPLLGATVGRARDFAHSKQAEVEAAFGVGEDVSVFAVADDSPAQRAGMLVGDRILEVDGEEIKRTKQVFEQLRSSRSGPVDFRVGRGDETLDLTLPPVIGCEFGTLILPTSGTTTDRAKNDTEILVPTGLVRFVRDDDELAVAIAHQMGHQLLGSFESEQDEPRADVLGLRLAASAGFDVSKASHFWDRWAAEQFWTISSDMDDIYITHGAMSWRAPVIRQTLIEIEAEARSAAPK